MKLHRFNFRIIKHLKYLAPALILSFSNTLGVCSAALAESYDPNFNCSDIKLVYARESGAELGDLNYERFTTAFLGAFKDSGLSIGIYELGTKEGGYDGNSYPSPGVGIETWQRFKTSIGAFISAGETYSYGESVKEGAREMVYFVNRYSSACPNSKIVLAGYSQGAQVVSLSLQSLAPSKIYAALTFGDPKLYLPEGKFNPLTVSTPACSEGRAVHSPYRANVPDCYAYKGILGGYVPYQPSSEYDGKVHAYCQFHDIICSAYIDPDRWYSGHASYKETGAYDVASKKVYDMIFEIEENPVKNLAILFDATESMNKMIGKYKSDTIKSAKKVLSEGGKVALYTFGDLKERDIEQLCDFSTCSEENISSLINSIETKGGGDDPESVLSGSYKMMQELHWSFGANKSVLVVTDNKPLNPDRDGTTLAQVKSLSYEIDPVNIYVLTKPSMADAFSELTSLTNGKVYTTDDEDALALFETDFSSFDPAETYNSGAPVVSTLSNINLQKSGTSSASLSFETDGIGTVLIVNDDVLGYLETNTVELADLDFSKETTVCLASVSTNGYRSETVCETISADEGKGSSTTVSEQVIPKAPKTGRR
ncbi:cutinase family protein [Candidatus Saccharibacteria bacterium]|nr:cutinase family protein [Candidatus Saccharibacteria bacterium]